MNKKKYLEALVDGLLEEMRRDERVFLMGQDIRSGVYGDFGDLSEFGERIRNLPISEAANLGAAIGAALTGMRPVIDMTFSSFLYSSMDQVVNQAAKIRYMFGGQTEVPIVIRTFMSYRGSNAAHHSDRPYSMFMTVPGLKIIAPSTPADAKGLIKTAIREPDPVLTFEDSSAWGSRGEVADGDDALIPLGEAAVMQEGSDVTLVGIAGGVRLALQAVRELAKEGVSVELIDPRTLVPMDWETICASVGKTGRLVVVDPAPRTCSAASEIAATVGERCFGDLRTPPVLVTTPDIQTPFSPNLETEVLPGRDDVVAGVRRALVESRKSTNGRSQSR